MNTNSPIERLSKLSSKERLLSERLIRHQTQKEAAERELKQVEAQALEAFGTSDLGELRKKYQDQARERQEALDLFESELNALEKTLNEIDENLANVSA
jgi:hypothetical protein